MIVALLGLSILQVYFLMNAVSQKEQAFEQNVMAALNSAVEKLQAADATKRLFVQQPKSYSNTRFDIVMKDTSDLDETDKRDSLVVFMEWTADEEKTEQSPILFFNDTLRYTLDSPQRVRLQLYDPDIGESYLAMDTIVTEGRHELALPNLNDSVDVYMLRFSTDSLSYVMRMEDEQNYSITLDKTEEQRGHLIQTIVNSMSFEEFESAVNRLDPEMVDSVIEQSLIDAGIDLGYSFGVISRFDSSAVFLRPESAKEELFTSKFKARVFPYELFSDKYDVAVYFPNRASYIGRQVLLLALTSGIFLLVISIGFVLLYRTIGAQHRFADHLVGFINNMTHEFKTPISTIALASEALNRDEVSSDKNRIAQYNAMIKDESYRMKDQVEKILQVALIEEGDFDLQQTDVDLHEVIETALSKLSMRVSERNGTIETNLSARESHVAADPVHITNVIYNLLDNAEKYSPDKPQISISTRNRKDGVVVAVEDRGRGISKDDLERIFDKYYRVQSGNLHDVKGFGLGLSYVKLIVELHGGSVTIDSRLGDGSRVEIYLPFRESE